MIKNFQLILNDYYIYVFQSYIIFKYEYIYFFINNQKIHYLVLSLKKLT